MKISLIFVFNILYFNALSQIVEQFSGLSQWQGQSSKFEVLSNQLHLNDVPPSSPAYLATVSEISLNATWEFWAKMNFAPSAANKLEVVLMSDKMDMRGDFNGYFLSIGENGSLDAIELYKKQGAQNTKIGRGSDARFGVQLDSFWVKVTRDANYNWTVYTNTGLGYIEEFSVQDTTVLQSDFFGFVATYTSTRNAAFYFDNVTIVGDKYIDNIPPQISDYQLISDTSLQIYFSENIDDLSLSLSTILVNNSVPKNSMLAGNKLQIVFEKLISDVPNTIQIAGLKDENGNVMFDFLEQIFFHQNRAGEVLINEWMADPSESIGMPNAEFVELYNASGEAINLKNWTFSDPSKSAKLPDFVLGSKQYVLLTLPENTPLFIQYGNVLGIPNMPSLNNGGDQLWLKDSSNLEIHYQKYSLTTYRDTQKEDGGYSLEMQNTTDLCLGESLLSATLSTSGGTPGSTNSGLATFYHALPTVYLLQQSHTSLTFQFTDLYQNYNLKSSYAIHNQLIDSVFVDSINHQSTLFFDIPLPQNAKISIHISDIFDCLLNQLDTTLVIFFSETPVLKDLIISEILFNPPTGSGDFVEFFQNATHSIRSDSLFFVTLDEVTNQEISRKDLPPNFVFEPNQYYVFTEDKNDFLNRYIIDNQYLVIDMDLPTLNDDGGKLAVYFGDQLVLDLIQFSPKFHAPFITNEEGKSLEKIHIQESGTDPNNWFTAAESVGFASPTKPNSASQEGSDSNFSLSHDRISPDGDGFEDFTLLHFQEVPLGTLISVSIFNKNGVLIEPLFQNHSIVGTGSLKIEGRRNGNSLLNAGVYVLLVETFDVDGKTREAKMSLTVNVRF